MVLFFLSKSNPFHWASIRFLSRSKHRSVSASRRKLHYVSSFFLFRIEPAPLGFDWVFIPGSRRERNTMERFWEHSWKRVDPERVVEYVRSIDMAPDALISALHRHGVKTVCDAGCGCGAYARKLAANGFSVCGFDVSSRAVEIARMPAGSSQSCCGRMPNKEKEGMARGHPFFCRQKCQFSV